MVEKNFVLGVDVGTTSVKVCVVEANENKLVARQSKDTQANVPSELGCEGNKQDVPKIVSALHACVSRLPKDLLKQVKCIGVCGQMHGVMLWRNSGDTTPWIKPDSDLSSRFDISSESVSSLYTWQDSRCDPDFLTTLPKPVSHLKAYSGYGCNTLFWIAKNRPEKFAQFNCAGTIQDFVVSMLCNLEKPVMTNHIAASWGYFETQSATWNVEVLANAGFPVNLLPKVVAPGEVAGGLNQSWHGIPRGTPVVAALGDLQCSVRSALHNVDDAVLNISTSAQIAFIAPKFEPELLPEDTQVELLPYFDNKYLASAAALNGGNVLATFISMLQHWTLELGFSTPQSNLWKRVIELGSAECADSSIEVVPTLLGERRFPEQNASVSNIDPGNISLGQVFKGICKGVVNNLHSMMPRDMLIENKIVRIIGVGSALSRNQVLQKEIVQCYDMPVTFEASGDAAWGAAMSTFSNI